MHGRVFYAIIAYADINSFKFLDRSVYQNFNEKFWKNSLIFGVEVFFFFFFFFFSFSFHFFDKALKSLLGDLPSN